MMKRNTTITTAEALKNEGNRLAGQDHYEAAIEKYKAALAVDPRLAAAQFNMGLMYKKLENLPMARDAFEKTLVLDPNYSKAKENLKDLEQHLSTNKPNTQTTAEMINLDIVIPPGTFSPFTVARPAITINSMVDLHGDSTEEARRRVQHEIQMAEYNRRTKIRFVTGRGNHMNARGERGTLYREFLSWIEELKDKIESIEQCDGYYEVSFKEPPTSKVNAQIEKFNIEMIKHFLPAIQKEAESGSKYEQMLMAYAYEEGHGVNPDHKESARWMARAAEGENGLALAQYKMASCYVIGKGVRQNDEKCVEYLTKAGDQDYDLANNQLGDYWCAGIGVAAADKTEGFKRHKMAADAGNWEAARKVGCAYYHGHGVPLNYKKAFHYYNMAAKGNPNDATAQFNLAGMYYEGTGTEKSEKQAFYYFGRAAIAGDGDGYFFLAYFYAQGIVMKPDPDKVRENFIKGASLNSRQAAFCLFYDSEFSLDERMGYLKQAANLGFPMALLLALRLLHPTITEADRDVYLTKLLSLEDREILEDVALSSAKHWTISQLLDQDNTKKQRQKGERLARTLIQAGDLSGYCILGCYYIHKKNYVQAHKELKVGANKGDKDCYCTLGYLYAMPDTSFYDLKKSFEAHSKAAELGSANSHNQLGVCYFEGEGGIGVNGVKALEHFKQTLALEKSVEQWDIFSRLFQNTSGRFAAFNTGRLYLNGCEGVKLDFTQAENYLKEATTMGHDEAPELLGMAYLYQCRYTEALEWLEKAMNMGNEEAALTHAELQLQMKEQTNDFFVVSP